MAPRISMVLLVALLTTAAALAQNARSAVSILGSDSNPCTIALPCRSFVAAIAATAPDGEIIALDSGGYGPFTVDRAVSVSGAPGVHAAISSTAGAGISVAAGAGDRVVLRNLVLISDGSGFNGIDITSAAETRIFGCGIRGFSNAGVNISGSTNLSIDSSVVAGNGTYGINIGNSSTTTSHATVSNTLVTGQTYGIVAEPYTDVVVVGSRIADNDYGVQATSTVGDGAIEASMMIERCVMENNDINAAYATATGTNRATITISESVVAFNGIAVFANGGGFAFIYSFQNNRFVRNSFDGNFTTTVAFK